MEVVYFDTYDKKYHQLQGCTLVPENAAIPSSASTVYLLSILY
jgi:hypothetical protein